VKVVKNKMAPPFKQAEFDILYGTGISREGSLIDFGVEHDIVKKSGAWYTYDGDQLGQGKENARKYLLEHADLADEIERKILAALGVGQLAAVPSEPELASDSVEDEAAAPVESLEEKINERKVIGA
jgi:recombination protein RecA